MALVEQLLTGILAGIVILIVSLVFTLLFGVGKKLDDLGEKVSAKLELVSDKLIGKVDDARQELMRKTDSIIERVIKVETILAKGPSVERTLERTKDLGPDYAILEIIFTDPVPPSISTDAIHKVVGQTGYVSVRGLYERILELLFHMVDASRISNLVIQILDAIDEKLYAYRTWAKSLGEELSKM